MIKSINFINYRNLIGKYIFNNNIDLIIGKNNEGKTNFLDGIRLAFSCITNDYFKIQKSDFLNSDDTKNIIIEVELENDIISSLSFVDDIGNIRYGFRVLIKKTQSGKYKKEISLLNGSNIDLDILSEDETIPNIFMIPLIRVDEIYASGFITGLSKFIESEEKYKGLKEESKQKIKESIKDKMDVFQNFCNKFNQKMDIALTEPKLSDEKVFIVEEGTEEHHYMIGSGYKSIANIYLNTLNDKYNIILIDEIENHLHPSLIRTFINELKLIKNTQIIATTHSPVVVNEFMIEEIIDIKQKKINLDNKTCSKLNKFLTPSRNELLFADNIILVEGYTEEILLRYYLNSNKLNWTIINVAGVMFEPYIELALFLKKRLIVVSDNDISLSQDKTQSPRFTKLENICKANNIPIFAMYNTLETDLYNTGYLNSCSEFLRCHEIHKEIMVAKQNCKTKIVEKLISENVDLKDWHIIKDIENEFKSN